MHIFKILNEQGKKRNHIFVIHFNLIRKNSKYVLDWHFHFKCWIVVFSLDSLVKTPQNNQENNISRQNYCVENNNLFTFLISIMILLANNVLIFPRFYRFYCAQRATADYCLPTKLPFPAKQSKYTKWWVELSSKIVEYLYNHVF